MTDTASAAPTYEQVIAAWNAQADEHNQWDALGEDEKIEWAVACAKAAPGEPTQEFEKWLATYSTLSVARDVNGYTDMTTEMLWHAWQADAKTKAPEGASAEWIDANARPDLALTNYTCAHDFSVQPSSGIRLCQKCGISETAARKAAPAPYHTPTSGEDLYWRLHGLSKILEGSGLIDESQHPDAYSTILDAMAFVRGQQMVAREPLTPEAIDAARAPADSALEDAARYRFLRSCNLAKHPAVRDGFELGDAHLDAAIDAARKQGANHD